MADFTTEKKLLENTKLYGDHLPLPYGLESIQPKICFYGQCFDPINPIIYKIDWKTEIDNFLQDFTKNLPKIDGSRRLIFVTHGFNSNSKTDWVNQLRTALVKIDKKNIIGVLDWGEGAALSLAVNVDAYPRAVANCEEVGRWLGHRAKLFKEKFGSSIEIWGIGHSLGAHLMGIAGEKSRAGQQQQVFQRITALDPAGVGYEKINSKFRALKPNDAKIVDVIHTDGHGFGTLMPLGTVDFYPDFGIYDYSRTSTSKPPTYGHSLAYIYFIWSVENKGKFSCSYVLHQEPSPHSDPTKSLVVKSEEAEMGYYCVEKCCSKGNYYLATNNKEPWAPYEEEKSWWNIF